MRRLLIYNPTFVYTTRVHPSNLQHAMRNANLLTSIITFSLILTVVFSPGCKDDGDPVPPEVLKASFSAAPFEGRAPLTVQFTDESTGSPISWKWDLQGDGAFDDFGSSPSYTYDEPGFYDVKLVVSDGQTFDSTTILNYIYLNREDEQLSYQDTLGAGIGETVEILLTMGQNVELGAITLSLLYDKRLIEVDTLEGAMSGYVSSINPESGSVFVAWSSVNPLVLAEDEVLFRIRVNILTGIGPRSHYIRLGPGTEFADPSAAILKDIELRVPYVDTGE